MFSKACEYGIKACIYIAMQSTDGKRVSLNDIAKYTGSPIAFTAKILHQLSKGQILESLRGPKGGFIISTEKIDQITLADIVKSIDGDSIYIGCGLGLDQCDAKQPCPIHDKFVHIRTDLKNMLETTYLTELSSDFKIGTTFLTRINN